MSTISMELVKELRAKTQVSLMECKKSLEETNGDLERAMELLRKRGAAVAAKRSENETSQGRVACHVDEKGKHGALVQISCETDFSANTEDMQKFAQNVATLVDNKQTTAIDTLLTQALSGGSLTVQQTLEDLIAKISESIKVANIAYFEVKGAGTVQAYIHPGSLVGILIEIAATTEPSDLEALKTAAKNICMQIAVTRPLCITPDQLDQAVVAKERALAQEQVVGMDKPANVLEKIVESKVKKFYSDVCLVHQPYIKNDKISVQQYLDEVGKACKTTLTINQFVRFGVGNK